jgi:hypothetical protein
MVWQGSPGDRRPYANLADNPLGGFMHGCFQGENVHDALNNALPGQRKRR